MFACKYNQAIDNNIIIILAVVSLDIRGQFGEFDEQDIEGSFILVHKRIFIAL